MIVRCWCLGYVLFAQVLLIISLLRAVKGVGSVLRNGIHNF